MAWWNQAERNLVCDALFIIRPASGYKMLQAELVKCNLTSRATTLQNLVYFFRTLLEKNQIRFPKTPHSQSPAWSGGKRSGPLPCINTSWACRHTQHCAREQCAYEPSKCFGGPVVVQSKNYKTFHCTSILLLVIPVVSPLAVIRTVWKKIWLQNNSAVKMNRTLVKVWTLSFISNSLLKVRAAS